MDEVIVGLDIGTTKTCAVIGYENENGMIEVAGVGVTSSRGLKGGTIVNVDNTVFSISKAIEDAELMAGHEVSGVIAGISSTYIKGENSRGVVAVSNRDRTITSTEIKRVIEAAQAILIPVDREIMHVLSKEFSVDDQSGIKDPIGMSGVRLEAEVHIITATSTHIQNAVKVVNRCGFHCHEVVFNPLASAEAVLSNDEKELGVALIDIGGGTTDLIVYLEGGVAYSAVLGVGGILVTNDISVGLRTPFEAAEIIKKQSGCAVLDLIDASEVVDVPSVGGRAPRRLFRQELAQIIGPRMTEIMELVDRELIKSGKKDMLAAGIVLTGGGCMIEGSVEAAERVFNLPVRIGVPRDIVGLKDVVNTPQYANSVGLLKYGVKMKKFRHGRYDRKSQGLFQKVKKWFQEYL